MVSWSGGFVVPGGSLPLVILLVFVCAGCHRPSSACPVCVNTIAIDPLTGLPPDVEMVNGAAAHKTPSDEAKQRARQDPICDACVVVAIAAGKNLTTAEERHVSRPEHALF